MSGRTGLIPAMYGDQIIKYRVPYHQASSQIVEPNVAGQAFAPEVFSHHVDKPFEIWRMMVRLTAFDDQTPAVLIEPQPTTLEKRINLQIDDTAKDLKITKVPSPVETLISSVLGDAGSWEWEVPYTLAKGDAINFVVDAGLFPAYCIPSCAAQAGDPQEVSVQVGTVRVDISLQGYLLVLSPASETR